MFAPANRGEAVRQGGDSVSVADEHVLPLDLKRAIGEVSSGLEVVEHLLESTVGPGDAVLAGDGPGDVRSQELLEHRAAAASVELVLRGMQSVEQVDGPIALHHA